jgi:hypothetical protein
VAGSDFPRSILELEQRFGDEDACRRCLFASRWPDGFSCPRCGGASAGEQPKRRLWECRASGHQASVTAGTAMHVDAALRALPATDHKTDR